MKIAYIIHSYKLPDQLARLVNSLATTDAYFFIHVDKKIKISPFKKALENTEAKNIIWVEREYSNWGTIACVKAVLNALLVALNHKEHLEYFYCLSGQDYPIQSKIFIEQFFEKNKNTDFVKYFPLPYSGWKGGGIHRYNRFHFIISKNRYIRRLVNIVNFFLPRRKMPYDLKPFGGEFYLGLSRKSAEYIKNFMQTHSLYLPFFKYSYIPEEIFFQTILLNGPEEIINDINNETLTYIDWQKQKVSLPAVLTSEDFENSKKSDMLFARKFDENINNEILNLIDSKLLK